MSLSRINEIRFEKTRVFVDSSNVDRVMYDSDTRELVVRFNSGETYTYFEISEELFENIIDGVDVPKTDGDTWKKGVGPSVGATVYERLVRRGVRYKKGGSFR